MLLLGQTGLDSAAVAVAAAASNMHHRTMPERKTATQRAREQLV